MQTHCGFQAQWRELISNALYLEDIEHAKQKRALPQEWTVLGPTNITQNSFIRFPKRLRYFWHVELCVPLFRVC